jgi:hypothetical protein
LASADRPSPVERLVSTWRGPVGYCVRVYLVARTALFLVAVFAVGLLPVQQAVGVPGWSAVPTGAGWSNAITGLERADALWYLRIASRGYRVDDASAAFFPLYPQLAGIAGHLVGGHWLLGALLVSNLALIVALVLLYRLTALELSTDAARRVVVYACVFPTAFFLFAPYSESLFLALVLGALYAARRQRWWAAAGCAGLAAVTRSSGALLGLVLLVEAVLQLRAAGSWSERRRRLPAQLVACAAGPLALASYLAQWQLHASDWRRPIDLQKSNWGRESSTPWHTLAEAWRVGTHGFGGYYSVDLVCMVLAVVAAVWVAFRVRATYTTYVVLSLVFPLLMVWPPRPLMSIPRFLVVVFPLLWAMAALAARWRAHDAVVAVSAAAMGGLAALFIASFPIF